MAKEKIEKAQELSKKIDNIQKILAHLKYRSTGAMCTIYIDSYYANTNNSSVIGNSKIVDKMCDLLINEYTQELEFLQKELDNL